MLDQIAVINLIEVILWWGALLMGAVVCIAVGWLLHRTVRRGKLGRILATVIYGGAFPVIGFVPMVIAVGAIWVGKLAGYALFAGDGGNDGRLVGLGIMGMIIALGGPVLFAIVMIFQALTGWGSSE